MVEDRSYAVLGTRPYRAMGIYGSTVTRAVTGVTKPASHASPSTRHLPSRPHVPGAGTVLVRYGDKQADSDKNARAAKPGSPRSFSGQKVAHTSQASTTGASPGSISTAQRAAAFGLRPTLKGGPGRASRPGIQHATVRPRRRGRPRPRRGASRGPARWRPFWAGPPGRWAPGDTATAVGCTFLHHPGC